LARITVETQPGHAYTTSVTGAAHSFFADEPLPDGDDLGFSPYELLLAALGSCTAMTLEIYARRKAWPLERVSIRLTFDRIHERDCARPEQPAARIELITREITLAGPLDEVQRARLLDIAGKCPVHKTLMGTPRIVDTLVEPANVGENGSTR
jgi:putative redox protein